jgi:phytoene synthase
VDSGDASRWTIKHLHDRLAAVYGSANATNPVDRALRAVVLRHRIPRVVFEALLEGFSWEIEGRRYETLADVRAYSVRVAGTVGVAMSHVMGRRHPAVLKRACHLGVAMQLTNIARDVGEDARAGRLYLPRTWMREVGIDPDGWLSSARFSPALASVIRRLLLEARHHYEAADWGIRQLPIRTRAAIRAASAIYADIGRVIAEAGFDSVSRRAVTSGGRKLALAARAVAGRGLRSAASREVPELPEADFLIAASSEELPAATAPQARADQGNRGSSYALQEMR